MFRTTTVITKNKIYILVPKELEPAFQITEGAKECYVCFDTIPSSVAVAEKSPVALSCARWVGNDCYRVARDLAGHAT